MNLINVSDLSKSSVAQIRKELRAAHAVIARAETIAKQLEAVLELFKPPTVSLQNASLSGCSLNESCLPIVQPDSEATVKSDSSEADDCSTENKRSPESSDKQHQAVQADLFENCQTEGGSVNPNGESPDPHRLNETEDRPSHKRGTPSIGRRQALKNFKEIVGKRELIDLQDINRVFGYNRSTSGTFVKCAIRRGDLSQINYGKKVKFLAIDLKNFIKSWYDSVDGELG